MSALLRTRSGAGWTTPGPEAARTLELTDPGAKKIFGDLVVAYWLEPHGELTRLVGKLVVRYPTNPWGRLMQRLLPWGDLVMMRKQLMTLGALAERT